MAASQLGGIDSVWRMEVSEMMAVFIGILLGFLSGLGTGGGSLLILYLTLWQNMPQQEARLINLLFFLPSALIASIFRIRKGDLKLKKVLPAIVAGSLSAGIFAWFAGQWDTQTLQKAFGVLLLFTGFRELLYKPK